MFSFFSISADPYGEADRIDTKYVRVALFDPKLSTYILIEQQSMSFHEKWNDNNDVESVNGIYMMKIVRFSTL